MDERKRTNKPAHTQDELLNLLSTVDRPCEFCTWGDRPLTMPGLDVQGLGAVRLPLGATQARKLIKLCRQAPYGKGTETVVDTNVRRVWELDPVHFTLTNAKWNDLIATIVADVEQALGLAGQKLTPHLYKLLLYEKGSFFLPHRDGEKLDRMVATLVIGLPSKYAGGELIVCHEGRQQEIGFAGAASGHELSFAAFYADCEHEVRPVRSGFRLCLTYNLTLTRQRGKKGISAPSYGSTATAIGQLLADWGDRPTDKIAVTLEHRYSQEGLSINMLKGIDRAQAEVLFEAAERADCVAHLALVTLWQCGAAEGAYDEYEYGRGRGYHWSEDEDEDDYDETASQYEMGEVFDHSLSLNYWSDREGRKVSLGEIQLDESEVVSPEPLADTDPNREDFEGYTGNAGMTLQRWYHRAAIVIWPRNRHFHILCSAGTDASVGGLASLVARLPRVAKAQRERHRDECLSFAAAIIETWTPSHDRSARDHADRAGRHAFPGLLCQLDDVELVRRFLSQVMTADNDVQLDTSFVTFCKQHGWPTFSEELTQLMAATTPVNANRNAELLRILGNQRDKNADRVALCASLCTRFVEAFVAADQQPRQPDWRFYPVDRKGLLVASVSAMLPIGAEPQLTSLLNYALDFDKFDLTDAHLAAVFALEPRFAKRQPGPAVSRWLAALHSELERRTAQAPPKPLDCRRASKLSCTCADCRALSTFLADPDQREGRFPLPEQRRRHLHDIIQRHRCDCTHVTLRRGRPYVLVCTKTTASYEAACAIYDRDREQLARLTAIERKSG